MGEVMEDHIREHIVDADGPTKRRHGAKELIEVVRAYLK
jgi:DNA-binding FrmR family transcriptional regulator